MSLQAPGNGHAVSPFSTGGGGTCFEYRVARFYLVDLLCGRHPMGLQDGARLQSIALQQRNRGNPVDDIVLHATLDHEPFTLSLQVKHALAVTESNPTFREVLSALWERFVNRGIGNPHELLGIAVADTTFPRRTLTAVREVCEWARCNSDAAGFFDQVRAMQGRERHVEVFRNVLASVAGVRASDDELWDFLIRFRLLTFDLDEPEGRDTARVLSELNDRLSECPAVRAEDVQGTLLEIVERHARTGGELTVANVQNHLRPEVYRALTGRNPLRPVVTLDELQLQAERQIEREKHSGRYLPDVYVENSTLKDLLRCFCHPVLFLGRVQESLGRTDLTFLNRRLVRAGLLPLSVEPPPDLAPATTLDEAAGRAEGLQRSVDAGLERLRQLRERPQQVLREAAQVDALSADQQACFPLAEAARRLSEVLEPLREQILWLQARVVLITAPAGHGKTNLLCDVARQAQRAWRVPCAMVLARELVADAGGGLDASLARLLSANAQAGSSPRLREILAGLADATREQNLPRVLMIDGLNEHPDLARFPAALARLLNDVLRHPGMRVVLACRSEHFDARFHALLYSDVGARMVRPDARSQAPSAGRRRLLLSNYFECFHLDAAALSERVRQQLTDNPLWLRLFCETEGSRGGPLRRLPPIGELHKAELFGKYLDHRAKAQADRRGFQPGSSTDLRTVVKAVGSIMLDEKHFEHVSLSRLEARTSREAVQRAIAEDLLLHSEIPAVNNGLALDDAEFVRFALDEFRDYVLAVLLVDRWKGSRRSEAQALIVELLEPTSPVCEGVRCFLFCESRRPEQRALRDWCEDQPWHDNAFLDAVFALPDDQVDARDAGRIETLWRRSPEINARVFWGLWYRGKNGGEAALGLPLLLRLLRSTDYRDRARILDYVVDDFAHWTAPGARDLAGLAADLAAVPKEAGDAVSDHAADCAEILLHLALIDDDSEGQQPVLAALRQLADAAPTALGEALGRFRSTVPGAVADYVAARTVGRAARQGRSRTGGWIVRGRPRSTARPCAGGDSAREASPAMEICWLGASDFLLLGNAIPSLSRVRETLRVREGSYGDELARRIHAALFAHTEDLVATFENFFSCEFESFEGFLAQKIFLPPRILEIVRRSRAAGGGVHLGSLERAGDGPLIGWLGWADSAHALLAAFFDQQYEAPDEDTQ